MAYDQIDMTDLWSDLAARIAVNEHDAAAMVDMSTILQSYARTEEAIALLREAVKIANSRARAAIASRPLKSLMKAGTSA